MKKEITSIRMGFNDTPDNKVQEFVETVEREGVCEAYWGVTGRTMHLYLAKKLSERLPQYKFELDYDRYLCRATKPA